MTDPFSLRNEVILMAVPIKNDFPIRSRRRRVIENKSHRGAACRYHRERDNLHVILVSIDSANQLALANCGGRAFVLCVIIGILTPPHRKHMLRVTDWYLMWQGLVPGRHFQRGLTQFPAHFLIRMQLQGVLFREVMGKSVRFPWTFLGGTEGLLISILISSL